MGAPSAMPASSFTSFFSAGISTLSSIISGSESFDLEICSSVFLLGSFAASAPSFFSSFFSSPYFNRSSTSLFFPAKIPFFLMNTA